ncbi:MAG TPA: T9SS type A sorting domain-containing protein [Bacteroidetes bacterium]|nr:T9SS type A sorting domain-containing protein [Bacteroidota bacterium]
MLLLAFSPFILSAQTYSDQVEMECPNTQGCEKIIVQVNTTITDNTSLECGEFDVSVTFDILQGIGCIADPDEDIYGVRWYVGPDFLNYNPRRATSVHFSRAGGNTLKLKFAVRTVCGTIFHKEVLYQVTNPEACTGCYSAVSYCDLYCNPDSIYNDSCGSAYFLDPPVDSLMKSQIPEIVEMVLFSSLPPKVFHLKQSNNYGIFNFPYYARAEQECPNLVPGLYELVEDLNAFLDLSRTGQDEYANNYGHVFLMDSYGDITEAGDTDKCKIRINFVDMGMFFFGFHRTLQYEFDLQECKIGYFLDEEDEEYDPRFGYDNSCIIPEGNINNSEANNNYLQYYLDGKYNLLSKKDQEYNDILSFMCFPTLASDKIDIQWESNIDEISIKIYDLTGRIQKKFSNIKNANKMSVDISKFNEGIYFIEFIDDKSGYKEVSKFIKQ